VRNLPVGVVGLVGLFVLGVCASGSSLLALLFPSSALRHVWRLNPEAQYALLSLGPAGVGLMLAVCVACSLAAFGLLRRDWWGHRVAVGILAVNVIGDTVNAVLRDDLRTLIGVPIGVALIVYLLTPSVARLYRRGVMT
jgi:hypothetical protein